MVKSDLSALTALTPSPEAWITTAIDDFESFLQDHASAEKKASGMALSMAAHYPNRLDLVSAMVDLAVEELNHYREVMRILLDRKITPNPDRKDPYVTKMNKQVRKDAEYFLLDRLLVAAIIERRGAERFNLIAQHIQEPTLKKFYSAITASEQRHWQLFVALARNYYPAEEIKRRFNELAEYENALVKDLPIVAALH
jgi:tRNA-(ms[2]io[6]A)-hydroxylase